MLHDHAALALPFVASALCESLSLSGRKRAFSPLGDPETEGIDMDHKTSKKTLTVLIAVLIVIVAFGAMVPVSAQRIVTQPVEVGPLDPTTIPKWVNQLTGPPPVYAGDSAATGGGSITQSNTASVNVQGSGNVVNIGQQNIATHSMYTVKMMQFDQQILPSGTSQNFPMTKTWARRQRERRRYGATSRIR